MAAAFASQGIVPQLGVTKISVNFNNTLVAISQIGTSANIAKKDNGIIITTNIPEPTSCLLAAFGLVTVWICRSSLALGETSFACGSLPHAKCRWQCN